MYRAVSIVLVHSKANSLVIIIIIVIMYMLIKHQRIDARGIGDEKAEHLQHALKTKDNNPTSL